MKHIKTYKDKSKDKKTPQIGDYVICTATDNHPETNLIEVRDFLSVNIGKYVNNDRTGWLPYIIEYENVPSELNISNFNCNMSRFVSRKEILHFSPNKEDLEIYTDTNKYNL